MARPIYIVVWAERTDDDGAKHQYAYSQPVDFGSNVSNIIRGDTVLNMYIERTKADADNRAKQIWHGIKRDGMC